jgi:hypothetical protein
LFWHITHNNPSYQVGVFFDKNKNTQGSIIYLFYTYTHYYMRFICFIYNYYKPSLAHYWRINDTISKPDSQLAAFDGFLVDRLNTYAPHYHTLSFKIIDTSSRGYYKRFTDSKSKLSGLQAKPSLFNFLMQHLGIQGYYNPFTGEAQVNRFLPGFMLPFVVCHEMAHQSGVANEGDANLMAYVVSTATNDTAFNYSAYLNIWLYVQSRMRYKDSTMAKKYMLQLNGLTKAHIDTLRAIRKKYQGTMSNYSSMFYDEYLRLHSQKGGIHSYSDVIMAAWAWEQKRPLLKDSVIKIP